MEQTGEMPGPQDATEDPERPRTEKRHESIFDRIFKAGERLEERGFLRGFEPLVYLFERRLRRTLTQDERTRLVARLRDQGAERVGDVVLDLTPEELHTWLAPKNGD